MSLGLGAGQQCDSFACRYAVRCREFRGLKPHETVHGDLRFYCTRHARIERDHASPVRDPERLGLLMHWLVEGDR